MIKTRLKLKNLFLFLALIAIVPVFTIYTLNMMSKTPIVEDVDFKEDLPILDIPVINITKRIINPYTDASVTMVKSYYDYQGKEDSQLNAIIKRENTYIQNNGIDYTAEKPFTVNAILEGTVTSVKDDEILGKIVEVKHPNNLVSSYQSLSEVLVKKGDIINQGQEIGKSGTNELDQELGNHLHFEIYEKGQAQNPLNYLNKEILIEE